MKVPGIVSKRLLEAVMRIHDEWLDDDGEQYERTGKVGTNG